MVDWHVSFGAMSIPYGARNMESTPVENPPAAKAVKGSKRYRHVSCPIRRFLKVCYFFNNLEHCDLSANDRVVVRVLDVPLHTIPSLFDVSF